MVRLVLVRHGSTEWNDNDLFSGWGDAGLSEKGIKEARSVGRSLVAAGFTFDEAHTSRLSRAQRTLALMIEAMAETSMPCDSYWRLNERHYGALQEIPRQEVVQRYGNDQTRAWRRSYRACPPLLPEDDPRWHEQCERFRDVPRDLLPHAESLEDGALRVVPYWDEVLAPKLREGLRVLIVAHTSSIRGLVRIIEGLSDQDTEAFRVPTAIPLVYELDDQLNAISKDVLHGTLSNRLRHFRSWIKPTRIARW